MFHFPVVMLLFTLYFSRKKQHLNQLQVSIILICQSASGVLATLHVYMYSNLMHFSYFSLFSYLYLDQ